MWIPSRFPLKGLYVITRDSPVTRGRLFDEVEAALKGGAVVIQYRAKEGRATRSEAERLRILCHRYAVPLIINDDVELALAVGADGVHVGREDLSLSDVRAHLGPSALIGVSCYDDVDRALAACASGADYVAFGRFFPSTTKPHAPCASLRTLEAARTRIHVPVVAIGGITLENGRELVQAGADCLAVIEGVFGTENPEWAASQFRAMWE